MKEKHEKFSEFLDNYLKDEDTAASFLSQALDEENFSTFLLSLKDVMRIHGSITSIAEKSKISRTTLYKMFSKDSNPELKTILSLLHTIGYDLRIMKRPSSSQRRSRRAKKINS